MVNFDQDSFEKQRMQIGKLIDKQEILIKSIANLEKKINTLNVEREINLKRIDLLTISLDEANTSVKHLQKEKLDYQGKLLKDTVSACKVNGVEPDSEAEVPCEIREDASDDDDNIVVEVPKQKRELNDRKIPVVFRNYLNNYALVSLDKHNESLLKKVHFWIEFYFV